jgi:hypothetical protein
MYFERMKATLTQLRRNKAKVVRPVMNGAEKLTLQKIDRRAACLALMAIGPVEFLPRK